MTRSIRRAIAALCVFVLSSVAVACHLSPQQAAIFNAIDTPVCEAIGGGLSVVVAPLGALVAMLCPAVANEIVSAETQPAADAGAPAADAGAAPAKASTSPSSSLVASAGCIPVLIPGDPLHQMACPELHEKILAAELRVFAKRAAAKAKAAK